MEGRTAEGRTAEGRGGRGQGRAPVRAPSTPRALPRRHEEHAHLSLAALRSYRAHLQAEEERVSYWRRIVQARLDVVQAGRDRGRGALDVAHLRPVLTDERVSAGRTALMSVVPLDDVPPLPDLAELWERQVGPQDRDGVDALVADLQVAEVQLSDYRSALHRRLEDATGELIARYRDEPDQCLVALPVRTGPQPAEPVRDVPARAAACTTGARVTPSPWPC